MTVPASPLSVSIGAGVPRGIIARESIISGLINMAISAGFFFALFGGSTTVPFRGRGMLIFDALPQGFMVGTMGALVPVLLVRRRMGSDLPFLGTSALVVRALVTGICGAAVIFGITLVLWLTLGDSQIDFVPALTFKMAAGAVLGSMTTLIALRYAVIGTHHD